MSRSNCTACLAVLVTFLGGSALGATPDVPKAPEHKTDTEADGHRFEPFKPESVTTNGSVTIGGRAIAYQAVAGTLIVHPKGWDDVPRDPNAEKAAAPGGGEDGTEARNPSAEASMFYVYYAKVGGGEPRPVTFFYNGGPGSSTMWLHL